jgi:hypothetical protein
MPVIGTNQLENQPEKSGPLVAELLVASNVSSIIYLE